MHYLIDGYNLIFRLGSFPGSLEEKRKQCALWLEEMARTHRLHITLFFDGGHNDTIDLRRSHLGALEIVQAPTGSSADEVLVDWVASLPSATKCCVITSDRSLAARCKAEGASTKTIEAFCQWLEAKQHRSPRSNHNKSSEEKQKESPLLSGPYLQYLLRIFTTRTD